MLAHWSHCLIRDATVVLRYLPNFLELLVPVAIELCQTNTVCATKTVAMFYDLI